MLTFFGTSPRSARFLELAIQNGLKVDLVVSEPPKKVGKKQILTENPTITVAKKLNIPFETVETRLIASLQIAMKQFNNLTIGLILDFNKIIPPEIINLFPKGIINIHFSRLPQYRGPAPVQYTILNGDKEAWITYYLISEKLDAGKIITQTSLSLDLTENTETLYQKLIAKSTGEINGIVENYTNGHLAPQPQSGKPSITHKLTTENCKIDWTKTPFEIDRLIRAACPEPGAWTLLRRSAGKASGGARQGFGGQAKRLKILKAHLENGKLILDIVQLEGKTPVSWKQFKEGHPEAEFT